MSSILWCGVILSVSFIAFLWYIIRNIKRTNKYLKEIKKGDKVMVNFQIPYEAEFIEMDGDKFKVIISLPSMRLSKP